MATSSAILPRTPGQLLRIVEAKGSHLHTDGGRDIVDAISGAMVANLGYGNEEIIEAIIQQARQVTYAHNGRFTTDAAEELALQLAEIAGGPYQVYFCGSGSETIEAATRINFTYQKVRGTPQRRRVLSSRTSYHGSSLGALTLTGLPRVRDAFEPIIGPRTNPSVHSFCLECPRGLPPSASHVDCADDFLREAVEQKESIGAVILEAMSANAVGAFEPPPGYLLRIRERTEELEQLLIIDEVATSIGRTGAHFAFQHAEGVVPDMICLSKGLGVGYVNIGAVLVHERVAAVLGQGKHSLLGHTYNGTPIGCAVALKALDILRRQRLVERNGEMGRYFTQRLRTALSGVPWVRDIRGNGLLIAIEIHDGERPFPASKKVFDKSVTALLERGILTLGGGGYREDGGGDHLTFAPQFLTTTEELDHITGVVSDFFGNFEAEVLSA